VDSIKLSNDEKEVVVDFACPRNQTQWHNTMKEKLDPQQICWIVVDFAYKTEGGGNRNKVVFISWCPDTIVRETLKQSAAVKSNSVFIGGKLKNLFRDRIAGAMQANCMEDLEAVSLLQKVSKFEKEKIDSSFLDS